MRSVLPVAILLAAVELACAQPSAAPLTVEQAVAEALSKNLGLLAEKANISVAQAGIVTARLRPNPLLSAGADHMPLPRLPFTEANGGGPPEYSVRTDFILERGGKRLRRTEVAEASLGVAELQFMDAARSVVLDVQNGFLDLVLARQTLDLARQNLESINQIVSLNETRFRAGDLAQVELFRSRLAALQLQNAVRQAELRLQSAAIRLETLLGRPKFGEPIETVGEIRQDQDLPLADELQRLALAQRPDLLSLRGDQARSEAELRLQLAQAKVDFSAGAEYRRQQGVNGHASTVGVFLSAPLPVFDRNQGEIARAREESRQVALRLRDLENRIRAEVETAYRQLLTARALLHSLERDALQQAREVRRISEYSYRRGEASLLEFLDAQRAYNETTQAFHEARVEYARLLYAIDAATGKAVIP